MRVVSELLAEVARVEDQLDKRVTAIRLDRATFDAIVEDVAPPKPRRDVVELLPAVAMEQYAAREDALRRGYGSWGKDGSQLFGIPIECVEDAAVPWEVVADTVPAWASLPPDIAAHLVPDDGPWG